MGQETYRVGEVRADEWRRLRELRLAALADPVAPVAFNETYDVAVEQPDSFWQQRTVQAGDGLPVTTFVGVADEGEWAGMVVVLVKAAEANLVGVYLRPGHRGTGLAAELFGAAEQWAWDHPGVKRLRLDVHEGNPRAEAFYRRIGFVRTGVSMPDPKDPTGRAREWEMVRERATDRPV